MQNDPNWREPRAPAVAIWTLFGLLVGVAGGFLTGLLVLLPVVCGTFGLLYGLFTTRRRQLPEDD
ncbi:MAG TPA: hypothetical protein VIU11_05180 [Nakamurella sp.]